jgi:hypothetical protein
MRPGSALRRQEHLIGCCEPCHEREQMLRDQSKVRLMSFSIRAALVKITTSHCKTALRIVWLCSVQGRFIDFSADE